MEMHYATIVERLADRFSDKDAIVFGDERVSWKKLDERASRLAQAMLDAGIEPGDRVGLLLYNCSEYMESMLAALKIRAVPININFRYTAAELQYILDDSDATGLIYHSSLKAVVDGALANGTAVRFLLGVDDAQDKGDVPAYEDVLAHTQPAPRIVRDEQDAFMLYTGGTTGMPKGVVYEIGAVTRALSNLIAQFFGLPACATPEEIIDRAVSLHEQGQCFVSMPASPLMHTAGVMNAGIAMQLLGGRMVILTQRRFDAHELWDTVEREKVNYLVIVGDAFSVPMLKAYDNAIENGREYGISSLRTIVSSGVMWSTESKRRLLELGNMMLIDGMGATEGAMATQISTRENPPTETARFTALPTTKIFDEDDREIQPGSDQPGFIAIGGQMLPIGYLNDEEKTAKTFRTIDGERYGFTGDMGVLESDGTMLFLGRGSGCINTGGEKVFPEEVEEVIKQHEDVIDCLVVGLDDERFGQRVAAVVASRREFDDPLAVVCKHCERSLAGYKFPREVRVVATIERGPNGKPDYDWAKRTLAS